STNIEVNFSLIGQSQSDISTTPRPDDLSHAQKLGADRQTCPLCRVDVDLQPDAIPVSHEANHASTLREPVLVTHGENRPVSETRGNLVQAIARGPADEQDVTGLDLRHAVIAPDLEDPPSYLLTADGLIEEAFERIVPENADDERGFGVGKGRGRPIDELREVEHEDGLHLSLGCPRRLRTQAGGAYQQQSDGDSQKRHATAPYPPPVCEQVLSRQLRSEGLAVLAVADNEGDRSRRVDLLQAAKPVVATVKRRHREGKGPLLVAESQLVGQRFL